LLAFNSGCDKRSGNVKHLQIINFTPRNKVYIRTQRCRTTIGKFLSDWYGQERNHGRG